MLQFNMQNCTVLKGCEGCVCAHAHLPNWHYIFASSIQDSPGGNRKWLSAVT